MSNEVSTTNELNFSVDFKQSEITVANKEQFESAIKAYASKYENLVISAENVSDAKIVRAEINKVKKGLDDKRKEIKNEFNEPLKQFETWIKEQKNEIEKVVNPIDRGIKELEELDKQNRKELVNDLVREMAETYEVDFDDVEIKSTWWENAGSFTKSNKPTKKIIEEIAFALNQILERQKQLESDIAVVTNYAKAVGLEPESWTIQVKNGLTAAQLMKMMDEAVQEKKAKKEYEEAIAKLKKESIESSESGVSFDSETGELVSEGFFEEEQISIDDDPFPDIQQVNKSIVIKLTAPDHLLVQARQYILGLGIILDDLND